MDLEALIDAVEAADRPRPTLRPHRGAAGISSAYFARLLSLYAHNVARAARLAAHWRAFLDYGDDPALAYRAKGFSDRLVGRWLGSARAFELAGEHARDEVDRLSFVVGAIDGYARGGRIDDALALGARLAAGLDALRRPELAARARLNTANALLEAERGPEARELYAQAIPAFKRAGMAMEEAAARIGLSTTHLYGGDPATAAAEAEAALAIARELGLEHLAALCEVNLAHFALVRGRADEAFAMLLDLRPRLEDSPAELARAHEFVGDACLRLNLFTEATEAYSAALAQGAALPHLDRAHVLLGLGEAERDDEVADRHLARAAIRYGVAGNRPWHAAALAARVSRRPGARNALGLARKALRSAGGAPYHETLAQLALAEALVVRGRDPGQELRGAERHVHRYGYRRFAWRVHALRARAALLKKGDPLPHHRRMLAEVLRERLSVTSVAARTGFLEDKTEALGAYLIHLLSNPTPRRVAEAREAIRRTRAATLLDEIVRSGSLSLDPLRTERLETLRAQVAQDVAEEPAPDARVAVTGHPARRTWTEATHVLGALDAAVPPMAAVGCVVLVEASGSLWALVEQKAIRLPIEIEELEELLHWLWFELQVPTAARDASPDESLRLLGKLRDALVTPWRGLVRGSVRLCPDGILWRVPWNALLDGVAPLLLHPSLAGGGGKVGQVERVAVWIDAPPDLPNAPAEERTLRERFPGARIARTRREVLASLGEEWDLIHVVGHARHNAENPMFSALSFPDGPIYAAEIARSGLRTRLACLSACETGALSHATRAEPDGLARAFLARGCEGVLASLWPLDDEAASRFFSTLYNGFRPGDDLDESVDRARRTVRAWRGHPYFWASLSLFGGYQP